MNPRRLAGAALVTALALPALAAAAPVSTTIRIEGAAASVLPPTTVSVDDAPGLTRTVTDGGDADTVTVPAASATAQLAAATGAFGLPLGFQVFTFGPAPSAFITRIGTDQMPPSFSPSWRLKVNGRTAPVGSDDVLLSAGDRVSWAFVDDFTARELELALAADAVVQGRAFTVTVTSVDNDGAAVPAAGARIAYGDQVATAGPDGTAVLVAAGIGVRQVQATRQGEVRSPAVGVCSYTDDPTVCSLPAPPPAPPAQGADVLAPGSAIAVPVSGRTYRRLPFARGVAGPDRSDVAGVEVSVARRVGTLCSYMGPRGRFGPARSCLNRRYVPARTSGGRWVLPLGARLIPGKYRMWSRATDGAGNRESVGVTTVNAISFRIARVRGAAR